MSKEDWFKAAEKGNLKKLNSIQINVETKNEEGNTALIEAAFNGKLAAVDYLIRFRNVNINAKNLYKDTALIVTAEGNHQKVVNYLLSMEANPNDLTKIIVDTNNISLAKKVLNHPFYNIKKLKKYAIEKNNINILELLQSFLISREKYVSQLHSNIPEIGQNISSFLAFGKK